MRHSLRSLPGSWLSFGLLASLSACDRGTTAAECSCPPPAAAPAAAAECPASSPVAAPEVTPKA
ncbi:MAG: hypothetical protein KC636_00645, partial [Myxococcales bacterium]|nr:hypothetical protein [Myxococcales bacterium]